MLAEALEMERRQNISVWARGGAAGLLGNFSGVALGLVWQFALARILGPSGYGNISLGFSIVTTLALLLPLGLDSGAMRYISFHNSKRDFAQTAGVIQFSLGIPLLLSLVLTPILLWRAQWIAVEIFKKPELVGILYVFLWGLPLFITLQVLAAIMQGFKKIGMQLFVQQILVPILRLMGLITLVYILRSVTIDNVALIMVIAGGVGVLALSFAVYFYYPLRGQADEVHSEVPIVGLMGYSLQALLMSFVAEISNGSLIFLLGFFASSSEIGIYSVAVKAATVLGLFLVSLNLIAAPVISSQYARGDHIGMHSLYKVITRWAFTLALPFFLMIMILAPDIMEVFGREFKAGAPVLQLVAIGQIINVATGPCGWMLNMTDHQHLNLFNNFLALLIAIALSLKLIPLYGAIGAAVAMGSAIALTNLLRLAQVYDVLHIHPYNVSFLKPIFAGVLAVTISFGINGMVSYPAGWMHLLISSAVLFVVYGFFFLILRLEPEDKIALQIILHREF